MVLPNNSAINPIANPWYLFSKPIKGVFLLQLFSIVSFSTILYTLGIYLVDHYNIPEIKASQIVASYAALNFAVHWLSGYLGDRWINQRTLLFMGLMCQIFGCLIITCTTISTQLSTATDFQLTLLGFATQLCGNGLCITCINCLLNQQIGNSSDISFRESVFLWNYSAMNIGFFIGLSVAGYYQLTNQYSTMFFISAISSSIALIILMKNWKYFVPETLKTFSLGWRIITLPIFLIALAHAGLSHAILSNHMILSFVVLAFGYFIFHLINNSQSNKNLLLFLLLALSALVFWTLYQITPITLIFFIKNHVHRHFLGWKIAPQWFENINTLTIVLGGPLLACALRRWRLAKTIFSLPLKFSCALALISLGLLVLLIGIQLTPDKEAVSAIWVVIKTILESLGELILSPIGVAMVAVLVPKHWQGIAMGSWLMLTGAASALAGELTRLSNIDNLLQLSNNLPYYMHTLFLAASIGITCSFALLLSSPELDPTIE
jgi:proton-dependent oligopeptide transporter, POT family